MAPTSDVAIAPVGLLAEFSSHRRRFPNTVASVPQRASFAPAGPHSCCYCIVSRQLRRKLMVRCGGCVVRRGFA